MINRNRLSRPAREDLEIRQMEFEQRTRDGDPHGIYHRGALADLSELALAILGGSSVFCYFAATNVLHITSNKWARKKEDTSPRGFPVFYTELVAVVEMFFVGQSESDCLMQAIEWLNGDPLADHQRNIRKKDYEQFFDG